MKRTRPPAAHLETSADVAAGVLLRDRPSKQTIPPERPCRPLVGCRERRSTNVLSSSYLDPALRPVPACRRHAVCRLPSHSAAVLPPGAPATYCIPRPSLPGSIVPVRPLGADRFRMAGRVEDDLHIWRSIHVPADRVPPALAQSAGSVPQPARSVRSVGSSALGAHAELPESIPADTPTSPICLRPTSATLRRNRGKPSLSVRAFAFGGADVPAAVAAPVSPSQPAWTILQNHSRCPGFARQLAGVANPPGAVPVVRCVVVASLTCARTASAVVG